MSQMIATTRFAETRVLLPPLSEARLASLFQTLDAFVDGQARFVMSQTVYVGDQIRRAVLFESRDDARAFLSFWRRARRDEARDARTEAPV